MKWCEPISPALFRSRPTITTYGEGTGSRTLAKFGSARTSYQAKKTQSMPNWYIGPLTVQKIISPVIVDLRSAQGKWHRHVHIQDLKPAPKGENNK